MQSAEKMRDEAMKLLYEREKKAFIGMKNLKNRVDEVLINHSYMLSSANSKLRQVRWRLKCADRCCPSLPC